MLKRQVGTKKEKVELAEFLGLTTSAVDGMLYYGKGGLDAWISAFIFCYDLDLETIQTFFTNYESVTRKMKPTKKSDQIWYELDEKLSEEEKYYWVNILKASEEVQEYLQVKKEKTLERSRGTKRKAY